MLKIFNKLTNKKDFISSNNNNNINIYVCGITPYSNCHIGHARTFIIFDIIIKYLKYLKYKITYVRNITDIDDKIIFESNIKNINYYELTNTFIKEYKYYFNKLDIIKPNYEPKVTNHIKDIINLIINLINKKHAYINNNGDVLFKINSYKKYGFLSNRIKKKNYFKDFVLWKKNKNKNDKPSWKSPWGFGRPGWHIECSTISNLFFKNNKIDIHGGGIDLLFPHHENEYAQSICAYKNFNVKHWIHIGIVNFLSKKISKSSNNTINLKDIINKYNKDTIRFYLTNKHYSKPLNYELNSLNKSNIIMNKLYNSLLSFNFNNKKNFLYKKTEFTKYFINSLNDNLNTPKAYSILLNMSNEINKLKSKKYNISYNLAKEMKELGSIIGLFNQNPKYFFKNYNINKSNINIKKINYLINKRNIERNKKNWNIADKIRLFLFKNNIILEDKINKTIWKYKK